jgi:peptide/nickel transport system permease protein
MLSFVIRRFAYMILLLVVASTVSFFLIELPPGDFMSSHIAALEAQGTRLGQAEIDNLRAQYGLNQPVYVRYFKWVSGILLRGDFGMSLAQNRPVRELMASRFSLTIVISLCTLAITYSIAIPVGVYSATHQYKIFDYLATGVSFVALGMPDFLLALIIMYLAFRYLGFGVEGLFSPAYMGSGWTWAKFLDLLKHLPVPAFIIGIGHTGGMIRVMRGCLLDELNKPYVVTGRAKGLPERNLLYKYPVRIAINPIISTIGWTLPGIVSGQTIIAIVLALPTTGPLLFSALMGQDMYLAGSIILVLAALTVVGTFISDVLLAVVDPRIRLGE